MEGSFRVSSPDGGRGMSGGGHRGGRKGEGAPEVIMFARPSPMAAWSLVLSSRAALLVKVMARTCVVGAQLWSQRQRPWQPDAQSRQQWQR